MEPIVSSQSINGGTFSKSIGPHIMNTVVDCILFSYQISSVANCYKLTILSNKWHSLKNDCSKQSEESRKTRHIFILLFYELKYHKNQPFFVYKYTTSICSNVIILRFSQYWHICDGSPVDLFIVSRVAIIKKLIKVGGAGPLTAGCSVTVTPRDTWHVSRNIHRHIVIYMLLCARQTGKISRILSTP